MDKAYLINQLAELAAAYELDIPEQILDQVISISKFKVYNKGDILARIGESSTYAGIVMNGVARCFYVDGDGNDVTRFFACEGNACMDDGLIGNPEYAAMWEALEETTVMLFEAKRMKELIMKMLILQSLLKHMARQMKMVSLHLSVSAKAFIPSLRLRRPQAITC